MMRKMKLVKMLKTCSTEMIKLAKMKLVEIMHESVSQCVTFCSHRMFVPHMISEDHVEVVNMVKILAKIMTIDDN